MKTGSNTAYWITTALIGLVLLSGGVVHLLRLEGARQGMAALGYPAYMLTILGLWKLLGGLTILAPGLPRLKEWAYAGIAFNLTGAAASHLAMGDPAMKAIAPLIFLAIAMVSWALRPASRRLDPR